MDTMEVLKQLIDMLGDASEVAGWVIGGFLLYKLIAYISVAGLIVSVCRLGIKKASDAYHQKLDVKKHIESTPRDFQIHGHMFTSSTEKEFPALVEAIHRYARTNRGSPDKRLPHLTTYVRPSDMHEIIDLILTETRRKETASKEIES